LTRELVESSWPAIIEQIANTKRVVWTALLDTQVVALDADVVTIGFPALSGADILKKPQGPGLPPNAELVREAIKEVTGHRVRFKVSELPNASETQAAEPAADEQAVVEAAPPEHAEPAREEEQSVESTEPTEAPGASWPTVTPPSSAAPIEEPGVSDAVEAGPHEHVSDNTSQLSQVGEAVIREVLGGQLISEHRVDELGEK
jgi:hypothetical protein